MQNNGTILKKKAKFVKMIQHGFNFENHDQQSVQQIRLAC